MTYQAQQVSTQRFFKALAFSALLATSSLGVCAVFASSINVNTATQTELESIKGKALLKLKQLLLNHSMVATFKTPMI